MTPRLFAYLFLHNLISYKGYENHCDFVPFLHLEKEHSKKILHLLKHLLVFPGLSTSDTRHPDHYERIDQVGRTTVSSGDGSYFIS